MLKGYAFHETIEKIFNRLNEEGIITYRREEENNSYDYYIKMDDKEYAVEVKSIFVGFSTMESVYDSLMKKVTSEFTKVLVLPIILSNNNEKGKKESTQEYEVWDLNYIAKLINKLKNNKLKATLADELNTYAKNNYIGNIPNLVKEEVEETRNLTILNTYNSIKPGRTDALEYEKICTKIIKFIFGNNIVKPISKKRTEDGLFEFDAIAKINPSPMEYSNFFYRILTFFRCGYIVFEFKNYEDKITQKEILLTAKYLYPKALKPFAIMITHKGVDEHGKKNIKGLAREEGKFIIVLDDNNISEMLKNSDRYEEILNEKMDDLLINLGAY